MDEESMPLDYEKMVDEDMQLDSEKMDDDEGMPLDSQKRVDVAISLDSAKMVEVAMPLASEKRVEEGMPLNSENGMVGQLISCMADYSQKNVSGRDTSVDQGIPLCKNINEFYRTVKNNIRKRLDVIFSLLRNSPKRRLAVLITLMTLTCTNATEINLSCIVTFPTTVMWDQPFSITVILENTTCDDDVHFLQVSDQLDVIARGNISYNKSVYNIFLDYSEMSLNYTLQINKVTFEDLKKEYRVECGRKTIPIKLLQDHEVILPPLNLQKQFSIENDTLIGTVILVNMYPSPTRYCITLQTPDRRNTTFDRSFLNGSDNNVPNLINKTFNVRETIEKNLCSGNVFVTIFVGDRVIATFSYQIFSNCSAGMNNEIYSSPAITIIITVMSVLGVVVIIVLGCMFKNKLKQNCGKLIETLCSYACKPCTDEADDSEMQETSSFIREQNIKIQRKTLDVSNLSID